MDKLPTLHDLRSALLDLKVRYMAIAPDEAQWALSDERIEIILDRIPYTSRMLEYLFGLQDSTHGKIGIFNAIAEVVNHISPYHVFEIDKYSFIVLKDGNCFDVNTENMSCSCGENNYRYGRKEVYGMCCHLAKVVFFSSDPVLQALNLSSEGIIRKHVESNTSDIISVLTQLNIRYFDDHPVNIRRHCERFIYVSYRDLTYSYYEPGLFWCFAPYPPDDSIASDLELLVLEEIFYVKLLKPNMCKLTLKGISTYDHEIVFYRENLTNGSHKELEKISATFQNKQKLKTIDVIFRVGYKIFKLKYHRQSMNYTKNSLNSLPKALKKFYLPFITQNLINLS